MRSIKEIFVIGHGPSSSHTMGPANACEYILKQYQNIESIKVTLYGSLASTGKGHLTDYIIDLKLKDIKHKIIFDTKAKTKHPNTIEFEITTTEGVSKETIISIGGGTIVTKHNYKEHENETYKQNSLKEILNYCDKTGISLKDYVKKHEDESLYDYLRECKNQILSSIDAGLSKGGYLPGPLKVQRKAKKMMTNLQNDDPAEIMAISALQWQKKMHLEILLLSRQHADLLVYLVVS